MGVGLFVAEAAATIGTVADGDGNDLIDPIGLRPVGGRMVFGPAGGLGRADLELIVGFAEGMGGAFVFALLLGELLLEGITFGALITYGLLRTIF